MTTITKGALVNGTYSLMRISGITVSPSNTAVSDALQVADDYAAELKEEGLDLGWQYPSDYGLSDPSDNSGLSQAMAGPFKKLLFIQLCSYFGKDVPMAVARTAEQGMRSLEQMLVNVPDAQNPPTLPFGSGNEWGYRDSTFYSEPPINNDADYAYKGDILNYDYDFSAWLAGETLVTVDWVAQDSGITIGTTAFTDNTVTGELTFAKVGGYYITITVTKTNSTDKLTVRKNFVISDVGTV